MHNPAWTFRLFGLLLVVGLPIAGSLVRRQSADRCALDGSAIDPALKVRIVDDQGESRPFCCIQCAVWWLERQTHEPKSIWVTDESSGQEINAGTAIFVRSTVVTMPTTGNRIHAFGQLTDAERHAEAARGTVLSQAEGPFRARREIQPSD